MIFLNITVSWLVMTCSMETAKRFGRTCHLLLQGWRVSQTHFCGFFAWLTLQYWKWRWRVHLKCHALSKSHGIATKKNCSLHSHHYVNLKSNIMPFCFVLITALILYIRYNMLNSLRILDYIVCHEALPFSFLCSIFFINPMNIL